MDNSSFPPNLFRFSFLLLSHNRKTHVATISHFYSSSLRSLRRLSNMNCDCYSSCSSFFFQLTLKRMRNTNILRIIYVVHSIFFSEINARKFKGSTFQTNMQNAMNSNDFSFPAYVLSEKKLCVQKKNSRSYLSNIWNINQRYDTNLKFIWTHTLPLICVQIQSYVNKIVKI